VRAGKTYTVRWLYVKNSGTIRSEYQVKVTRFSPGSSRPVPAGWVRLTPSTFRLSPGAIERVTVSVAIPASAPGGPYLGDLLAATYAGHTPGATALGAAAADQLTFRLPAGRSFPWPIIAIACAAALAVATGMAFQRNRLIGVAQGG